MMSLKAGDTVSIEATIVELTASGNPIIKVPSGGRFLIKDTDVLCVIKDSTEAKETLKEG